MLKNSDMPAMPSVHCTNDGTTGDMIPDQWAGLSKREHFAAMAMQGIVASLDKAVPADELAAEAVEMADALLTELEKTQ